MRIKSDFVTNSSSAAFTLLVKANGTLPRFTIPNNIREYFLDLGYAVALNKDYSFYKELEFHVNPFFNDSVEDYNQPQYIATIEDIVLYDEKQTPKTEICIVGKNPNYNDEHSLALTKDVAANIINNFINLLSKKPKNSDVNFSIVIEPTDFRGDGWNGDPMGPYGQITECYNAETKFGRLKLKKGELNFQLYNLDGKLVMKGPVEKI